MIKGELGGKYLLLACLIILNLYLIFTIIYGNNSWLKHQQLEAALASQETYLNLVTKRNAQTLTSASDSSKPEVLEAQARLRFTMVGRGEQLVQLEKNPGSSFNH